MPTQNFDTTYTLPHNACTEQDFYQLCRTLMPTAGFVDGTSMKRDNVTGQISAGPFTPTFKKITKSFTDLSYVGLTNDIEIFLLPAGGMMHAIKLRHSAAFTGGAVASYQMAVGISGFLDKYLWWFDVKSATSPTNFLLLSAPFYNHLYPPIAAAPATYNQAYTDSLRLALQAMWAIPGAGSESHTLPTSIRLAAKTTGANLNVATTGSVDVWIMYSILT